MKRIEITSEKDWRALLGKAKAPSFLQSWEWGAFQASIGKRVIRFAFEEEGRALCLASLIREERPPLGGYWIAPKGPVFLDGAKIDLEEVTMLLKAALKERSIFFRVEPELSREKSSLLPKMWRRRRAYNPSATYVADLGRSEEELLAAMHQKTRYNIRVAERHNVRVRLGTEHDVPAFLKLMKETSERDRFLQHHEEYLRSTYEALQRRGMARIRIAEHAGELLAANLEIVFAGTLTYLYGASSGANRNVMAPYLLHWEAMKAAKEEGLTRYDFWGANPSDEQDLDFKTSWKGISRFKERWGGTLLEYVGTYDISLQPLLYNMLKKLGRI